MSLEDEKKEAPELPNGGRPYLQIMIQEDGSLRVAGSTQERMLAYGLLEIARDMIKDNSDKQAKIERVNGGSIINRLRQGKF